jgi:hypothetical protein
MQSAPRFKAVIEEIAAAHQFDLTQDGTYLKVQPEGFMPLVIERVWKRVIAVSHTGVMNGDTMYDPDVQFYIDDSGAWIPFTFRNDYVGVDDDTSVWHDGVFAIRDLQSQAGIAEFCEEMWANNIRHQGFIAAPRID